MNVSIRVVSSYELRIRGYIAALEAFHTRCVVLIHRMLLVNKAGLQGLGTSVSPGSLLNLARQGGLGYRIAVRNYR